MYHFRTISVCLSALLLLLFSSLSTAEMPPKYQMRTVVIDPGHGGHDSGCLGSSAQEKHVALAVALKLGELIERNFPDIRVIFTRKTDVFVELHERAAIANRNKADLFICIHCNSGASAAFGSETYVMGLHKTESNLNVAKRENASVMLEKDYKTNYDGFDPDSPEANIIFTLFQNTFMEQSLEFATLLQKEFEHGAGRFNRGVKQAGFLVLYRTTMPSVLIETGFLTNHSDERFLMSEDGQDQMASSIFRAFRSYKNDKEKKTVGGITSVPDTVEPEKKPEPPKDTIIATQTSGIQNTNQDSVPSKLVYFTVQIGAVPASVPTAGKKYDQVPDAHFKVGEDGMKRYYSGKYDSVDRAKKSQMQLRASGFKDAFVCAFSDGKRISVADAVQLLKTK